MHGGESRIAAHPYAESHASSRYFLAPHVFLARAPRHWVILDVRRDKYFCADRRQFESLGPWIQGWEGPVTTGDPDSSGPRTDAIALADQLLSLGALSRSPDIAKPARPTTYRLPTEVLVTDLPAGARISAWPRVAAFFRSCIRASRHLRDKGFAATVEAIRARKHGKAPTAQSFDSERAQSLTAVFHELRLFYARPYVCLFDSLALINFLAQYQLYPDWVFGVSADPFEAHCWVQAGSVVLNDTLERVSAFTPIMYV